MKTIILSAGKGERLLPLTKDRPKILVSLGDGTTLLSRQCNSLLERSVLGDIVIGGGHCVGKIDEFIESSEHKKHLDVVYNPFYGVSGPLVTLWVVLNKIADTDFMFMNGDTIFSTAIYDRLQKILESDEEGIFLLCSRHDDKGDDDVKVLLNETNHVVKAGKNLENADHISAGLTIVKGESVRKNFRETLEAISRTEDFLKYNKTWHSFLNDLADQGIEVKPVEVANSEWVEIDIHYELTALQNMIKDKVQHTQF
jgi:choline kinase